MEQVPVASDVASIESVLCTQELSRRPSRPPDYQKENRALVALAKALSETPRKILQTLADTIVETLGVGSAGVSLLTRTDEGERFYWPAISGEWTAYIGGGTPRDFGPCGDVLDRNTALLFNHPERRYTYLEPAKPPVEEALLVPFYVEGKAVGTIWAVSHSVSFKFEAEDQRLLNSLAMFASSAYQVTSALDRQEVNRQQAVTFDTTLSTITDFAYIFDREGRFRYVNKALLDLWGLKLEDALGKNFFDLKYPEGLAERLQRQIRQVIDTKQGLKDETPYTSPTGAGGYYEYIFQPVLGADGNVESVAGSTRDISARKTMEGELREAKSRLETTLYASEVATWTFDIQNDCVVPDENLARLFSISVTKEDAAGAPLEKYLAAVHPEDRPAVRESLDEAIRNAGDFFERDYRLMQTDGSVRWVTSRGHVERDAEGKPLYFPGVMIDVTERKTAEQQVTDLLSEAIAANAKFRALFDQSPIFAGILDLDGKVIDANRTCLEFCGYKAAEVIGIPFWETPWWRKDAAVRSKIRSAFELARDGQVYREELPYHWADGSERVVDFYLFPVRGDDGSIVFLYPTGADITERKQAEAGFRKLAETLEAQVQTRTQELQARNAEILQQSQQLRDLSSRLQVSQDEERRRIARELHDSAGQIIVALGMNLDLMTQEDGVPNRSGRVQESRKLVRELSDEIRTMSYLLHPPLMDEAGLSGALGWYVEGLQQRGSGLQVELTLPQEIGRFSDETEMAVFRVVQECLTNIHRHAGASKVLIEVALLEDRILLKINDNGNGIPAGVLTNIRSHRSGVGITGMRERVRHLGGTMDIASDEGGTTVTVSLPRQNGL